MAALVSRAQRGGDGAAEAFEDVVRHFEPRLVNFLRHRLRSQEDIEDVTQETFLRAWSNLDRYDARWQFSTWLFTIGTRLAIGVRRRRRALNAGDWTAWSESDAPGPEAAVADEERRAGIWSIAEEHLTGTERTALWLRHAEDLSISDIARILDRSPVAVRVLMHRARRRLAAVIPDGGNLS